MLAKSVKEMTLPEKLARTYEILAAEETTSGFAARAAAMMENYANKNLTCAVIGQFKRGKSALVNRILGDQILPVGIVPITSAVTRVIYGEEPGVEVRYRNGTVKQVPPEELSRYISEQENSDNHLGIAEAVIKTNAGFLKDGLTLVDTPGVGSFHTGNTETAYDNVKESDAVVFLLSVDSPINEIEIDFLKRASRFAARFYFAVNKIDLIPEEDLSQYVDYCQNLLSRIMNEGTKAPASFQQQDGNVQSPTRQEATNGLDEAEIRLFPVSAKTGEGVEALKERVLSDLSQNAAAIADASVRKKLMDLVVSAINQLNFYWKAMNVPFAELDEKFEAINKELDDIKQDSDTLIQELTKSVKSENTTGGIPTNIAEMELKAKLNDYRLRLSDLVSGLFGMEYHYDIGILEDTGLNDRPQPGKVVLEHDHKNQPENEVLNDTTDPLAEFQKKTSELLEEFRGALSSILLYREENAYTVCHRINAINRATLALRRVRDSLREEDGAVTLPASEE